MGVAAILVVALCSSLSQIVTSNEQVTLPDINPIKTVKTTAGIYDCVDIRKQPAFAHPLLKSHQIRMKPTSLPEEPRSSAGGKLSVATSLTNVGCPQGTVPIRRAVESHVAHVNANVRPMNSNIPGQHLAILRSKDPYQTYYGLRAFMSLNNPSVKPGETSAAQMWAMAGPVDQQNAVEAGWMVSPDINGDNLTHLFVKSTTDGYKTSCYNTKCPSFVQIDPNHPVDADLGPISVPGGDQYIMKIELYMDNATLDWWLIVNDTVKIGYFPSDVFTNLKGGATYIAWGGLVQGRPGEHSPPMGNGQNFVNFDYGYMKWAAYFTQVSTIDASHSYINPDSHHLEIYNDSDYCYEFYDMGLTKELGYTFLYGGSGSIYCGV